MQHLTSYSLFESESAEPLYAMSLCHGKIAMVGLFPLSEIRIYDRFLNDLWTSRESRYAFSDGPIDPAGHHTLYLEGWDLAPVQGKSAFFYDNVFPLLDLLQNLRQFAHHQPGQKDQFFSLGEALGMTLAQPDVTFPSPGWETL